MLAQGATRSAAVTEKLGPAVLVHKPYCAFAQREVQEALEKHRCARRLPPPPPRSGKGNQLRSDRSYLGRGSDGPPGTRRWLNRVRLGFVRPWRRPGFEGGIGPRQEFGLFALLALRLGTFFGLFRRRGGRGGRRLG